MISDTSLKWFMIGPHKSVVLSLDTLTTIILDSLPATTPLATFEIIKSINAAFQPRVVSTEKIPTTQLSVM